MRKIPSSLENPIDNILIYFSELLSPFFKSLNFTPNTLTTISLALGIISAIFFWYENYKLSALFFLLAYFFDCADGFYARKYSMTSQFGDLYDHYSDYFKLGLILFLMFYKSPEKFFKLILPLVVIFFLLMTIQVGCQEKYKKNDIYGDMLAPAKSMCYGPPDQVMVYMRFFGTGTFILVMSILIYTFDDY